LKNDEVIGLDFYNMTAYRFFSIKMFKLGYYTNAITSLKLETAQLS